MELTGGQGTEFDTRGMGVSFVHQMVKGDMLHLVLRVKTNCVVEYLGRHFEFHHLSCRERGFQGGGSVQNWSGYHNGFNEVRKRKSLCVTTILPSQGDTSNVVSCDHLAPNSRGYFICGHFTPNTTLLPIQGGTSYVVTSHPIPPCSQFKGVLHMWSLHTQYHLAPNSRGYFICGHFTPNTTLLPIQGGTSYVVTSHPIPPCSQFKGVLHMWSLHTQYHLAPNSRGYFICGHFTPACSQYFLRPACSQFKGYLF